MRDSRRFRLVAALLTLVVGAGCGLGGKSNDQAVPAGVQATTDSPYVEDTPWTSPTTAAPTPAKTSAKPKPKPTKTKVTPTEDPNNFQLADCVEHEGKLMSKSQAKSALVTAAGKTYWPTSAPGLKVSSDLVKSVAWHESGWQSDIVNCDGGRGLMQVMPDTVDMINDRFGESYDATDYKQNALVGANFLAWLTKYFGDRYFKETYNLSTSKCKTHSSPCLLNMVIAGYNSGAQAVNTTYEKNKTLPNVGYIDSVRSLMSSCYCDRY
jgi:hypothetical protein